jgi:hypothetical protein
MATIRTLEKITSRKASYIPGDTLMELVHGIRDVQGREYPPGTTFRALAGGFDGTLNANYRDISIIRIPAAKEGA